MYNSNDWMMLTGSPLFGRGGRPPNPKLFTGSIIKAPGRSRAPGSAAPAGRAGRDIRRAQYEIAKIDASQPTPRALNVRSPSIYEQSRPGAEGYAAEQRHIDAVLNGKRRGGR